MFSVPFDDRKKHLHSSEGETLHLWPSLAEKPLWDSVALP